MKTRVQARFPGFLRLPCGLAVAMLALAGSVFAGSGLPGPGGFDDSSLAALPAEARGAISGAVGGDDPAYRAFRSAGGLHLSNARHGLRADFTRRGVTVESGADRVVFLAVGLGYGEALSPVLPSTPRPDRNRIEYRRGSLTEWYVNGPLGLEQGFTLVSPPARRAAGLLTLALSLSGTLTASPDPGGRALTLGNGRAALQYEGLTAYDAGGRELPARFELRKKALLVRVNDAAARYPISIDPFIKRATLIASDGRPGDHFGIAVAIHRDVVVVAAEKPPIFTPSAGVVYVFVKPAGGWSGTLTQSARLTASDAVLGSQFGISVDVSGDTVVVGASHHAVGGHAEQGAAYVFVKPAAGWAGTLQEKARLTASDGATGDRFGDPVRIDGNTIVVGVWRDKILGADEQGSAYVFVRPAGGWVGSLTQNAKLTASDGGADHRFGFSVAVSGDTVVAGAPKPVGSGEGSAYVFVRPAGGWTGALTESATLLASHQGGFDGFGLGICVGLNAEAAFAQADDFGWVYVYPRPAAGWAGALPQTANLVGSDSPLFGGIAVSGDTLIVPSNGATYSIYRFVKPAGGWAGLQTEDEKSTPPSGLSSVFDLAGNVAVFGHPSLDGGTGKAFVFQHLVTNFPGVPFGSDGP